MTSEAGTEDVRWDAETTPALLDGPRPSCGVPNGIRTRVLALKGPRPGPLDDGDRKGYNGTREKAPIFRIITR